MERQMQDGGDIEKASTAKVATPTKPMSKKRHGPRKTTPSKRDWKQYMKFFAGASELAIAKTFQATTQYRRMAHDGHLTIRHTFKSPNPALNVPHRHETVASDTSICHTPAVDNGSTCSQLYIGTTSLFASNYGIKTDGEFAKTLLDVIRKWGAMDRLFTDCAKAETSEKVLDILRTLIIDDGQSEPHFQHLSFVGCSRRERSTSCYILLTVRRDPLMCITISNVDFRNLATAQSVSVD
jgi:hypothetical protein